MSVSPEQLVSILYSGAFLLHKKQAEDPSSQPLSSENKRLRSLLDALASVCLYGRQQQAFAVSMSINQEKTPGAAIYVSQRCRATICRRSPSGYLSMPSANQGIAHKFSPVPGGLRVSENAIADFEISMYLRSFEKLQYRFTKGELHPLEESE